MNTQRNDESVWSWLLIAALVAATVIVFGLSLLVLTLTVTGFLIT